MSAFLSPLIVEWVDSGHWRLLAPLRYESDLLGRELEVPGGFLTDFASVPRLPLAYLIAGNRGHRAAVVHDYLYSTGEGARADADAVLREALPLDGVSAAITAMMYDAVRKFGASHWTGAPEAVPLLTTRSGEILEGP